MASFSAARSTVRRGFSSLAFGTEAAMHRPVSPGALAGLSTPIVTASTYQLAGVEAGARLCLETGAETRQDEFLYSRWGNPTTQAVQTAVAALEDARPENGGGCFLLSSGMAAVSTALLTMLRPGDHVVAPQSVYGGTHEFLTTLGARYGYQVDFVDPTNIQNFRDAVRPNTKLLYAETPCNPTMRLTDLKKLGELNLELQDRGCSLLVDSTLASPYHQQPLTIPGVTAVLHSGTKYLAGHSDVLAGAVVSRDPKWLREFGETLKLLGCSLPAHDSFLLGRGLKTLDVRMERHNRNAAWVARFLADHPKVASVSWPGLRSHPDHELAKTQMRWGYGGMLAFEVAGDVAAAARFVESLKVIKLAVSLGSVESLIEHAASMTHAMVPREVRLAGGITDGLVRLSVGIEDAEDLMADLDQALSKV